MRSLPRIVSSIPSDLRNFLDRVREYLGEGSDERFVTLGELRRGGIVGTTPNGAVIPPTEYAVQTPTVPKNVTVTGGFAVLFIEWDTPDYLGHAYAEVWAAPTDDFAAKELVGTAEGNIFTHSLGTGATRYYWVRFVNLLDTVGPFNGTAGTPGTTSQDPDYLIEVLSDAYGVTGPAPFFQIDTPTVINGVTIPAGTYIKQAWIADATISRAKIQDLAVDNAKINDLSVAKLTAGAMQVGSYIQSTSYTAGSVGWRINADGSAEFSNVTVRGSIYSTVGTIGGTTLSATGIQANYVANTSGWKIGSDGSAELNNLLARGTLLGGAATGYNSGGTGFFAGTDSGSYKWRVGDITTASTPKYVRWTGSNLEISSGLTDIINTPNVTGNALSQIYVGTAATYSVAVSPTGSQIAVTSVSVPSGRTGVLLIFSCTYNNATASNASASWEFRRDGSRILDASAPEAATITIETKNNSVTTVTRVYFDDAVTAGTHDYQIYARTTWTTNAGGNLTVTDQTLTCIPFKR